ncbi:hypothetical protein D3C87_1369500 [compost metagenome]
MQKPHDSASNVHFLNQLHGERPHGDVLATLYDALKQARKVREECAAIERAANEQRIKGEGNVQLSGGATSRQSISGNNNVQIGALQVVVKIMMNVEQ